MPPTTPLRALRAVRPTTLARTAPRRHGSHGAPQFNEPSGLLFSESQLPAGQKRVKEDWENIWYIGMFGTMGLTGVLLYYKPDSSIQSWALKEAKERMEARGELPKYESKGSS